VFEAVTAMILSCLPGHHPDDFTDPTYLTDWLKAEDDYLVMPSAAVSEPL
jgi:hypothetical protein